MKNILKDSSQLLAVIVPDCSSIEGTLYRYERTSSSEWELIDSTDVNVGRNGSACDKKEGDGKSPLGIFPLRRVFGDEEHRVYAKNMPFILIEDDLECVDDPNSRYYNQFVNSHSIRDWKSSEQMVKVGFPYSIGIVVEYNTTPCKAGAGSAIFIHVWRAPKKGSAGCYTLDEKKLNEIVAWLDVKKNPHLVHLTCEAYNRVQ